MKSEEPPLTTGAVVAVKQLQHAKSRMAGGPVEIGDPLRRRLAHTMAFDTLAALAAAADRVVVVTDRPALRVVAAAEGIEVDVVAEPPTGGLNAAFVTGARWLQENRPPQMIIAAVADLPSLRAATLLRVFVAAAAHDRAYVADASGIGTTMLTTTTGVLDPHFQGRSAAAHRRSGAQPLQTGETGGPIADARRDVDTPVDLYDAWGLGLGPRTALLVDPATGLPRQHDVVTVAATPGEVITGTGRRAGFPAAAWPPGQLGVGAGQRLHAVLADGQVLTSWR